MKMALNGALTIGTEDGANIEIRDQVGAESIFIFGHDARQVAALDQGGYQPLRLYEGNERLRAVLDAIAGGRFSPEEPDRYRGIVDGVAVGRRPLQAARRLRRLRAGAGARGCAVPAARRVAEACDRQRGRHGAVLVGPQHPHLRASRSGMWSRWSDVTPMLSCAATSSVFRTAAHGQSVLRARPACRG
jgi:hypothetical protein